jgi:2,4-diaminopentanoate dehydrogenase
VAIRVALIEDPQFELTEVGVSTGEKVGKDAGELAGLDVSTGISAIKGLDGALATEPDCVVYTADGDTQLAEAMADVRRLLAAGINVVGARRAALPVGRHPREIHRAGGRCCAGRQLQRLHHRS